MNLKNVPSVSCVSPKSFPNLRFGLSLLLALNLSLASVWAQNSWTDGAGNDDWGDAGNWSGAAIPVATENVVLGDGSPDAAQTINLGADRTLSNSLTITSSGDRDYTISGTSTLNLARTDSSPASMGIESGASGTATLNVDSNVEFSNTKAAGIAFYDFFGSGSRIININGDVTSAPGGQFSRTRMMATNTQLHIFGSIDTSTDLFLTSGEVVLHSANALGNMALRGGGGNSTISLAADSTIAGSGGNSTNFAGNIDVRIREDASSSTDRVLTFSGRALAKDGPGTFTVVDNINSTGRVILNVVGASTTTTMNVAVDLGDTGMLRFSNTTSGIMGARDAGTGIISGDGDVEVIGGANMALTAVNTYTGSTSVTNASTLLLSGGGSIAETSELNLAAGTTFDISGIDASGYTFGSTQTVAGSGEISTGGKDLTINGTLAPGSSPGTLTMDLGAGTLLLGPDTDLQFELGTLSDLVDLTSATGTLDIGTSTLDFSDFSFVEGSGFGSGQYTLFQNAGGILGTFGTTTGSIGSFSGEILFSGNDLVLNVVPEPGTSTLLLLGGLAGVFLGRRRKALR